MKRFVEGEDRSQVTLLPECLDDFVVADNPVRVIDVFIDALDLTGLGFDGVAPADTGRPAYHPAVLLKIYVYGYLNRLQSSRRLERETQRNVELMWVTGRLAPATNQGIVGSIPAGRANKSSGCSDATPFNLWWANAGLTPDQHNRVLTVAGSYAIRQTPTGKFEAWHLTKCRHRESSPPPQMHLPRRSPRSLEKVGSNSWK
jgi:hypothetical protein